MPLHEVLGTIVAEISFQHVALVIIIGDSSSEALLSPRKPVLITSLKRVYCLFLVIKGGCADRVLPKGAIVLQRCLHSHFTIAAIADRSRQIVRAGCTLHCKLRIGNDVGRFIIIIARQSVVVRPEIII